MRCGIITIGDELLRGDVVNSNAAEIGRFLAGRGFHVVASSTVRDREQEIVAALQRFAGQVDLVIVSGGLGPTPDDRAREGIAAFFGVELDMDEELLEQLRNQVEDDERPLPVSLQRLAERPGGAQVIANPVGLAPGLFIEGDGTPTIVALPGVPDELRVMLRKGVAHLLPDESAGEWHEELRTCGIREAALEAFVAEVAGDLLRDVELAYLPSTGGVVVRVSGYGDEGVAAARTLAARLEEELGPVVYSTQGERIERVVGAMLRERGDSVAAGESCTGGHVISRLTDIPGASRYVHGGIVAYANEVKRSLLEVDAGVLERYGAVSEEVAVQMAAGARSACGADWGISTTGIAGPGGGTEDKPVGTVWIAVAGPDGVETRLLQLSGTRMQVVEKTATLAMDLLRRCLLGYPIEPNLRVNN